MGKFTEKKGECKIYLLCMIILEPVKDLAIKQLRPQHILAVKFDMNEEANCISIFCILFLES